ncbi:MAG: hypothetical protein E7165_02155 [Firmicutes bacterium]|nr:hypothetical protein [Bacillota bacterium]
MLNLFLSLVRMLFAMLDHLVVWAIKLLYTLLIQIASTNVFGNFIYEMLGRIYVFLGIFMLFKLSMSVITYIINPDTLTDKSKGFSKMITNVVISLILLVVTPSLFREVYKLQGMILNTNAIYQIVTGYKLQSNAGDNNSDVISNADVVSSQIVVGVFRNFIYKNTGDVDATTSSLELPINKNGQQCQDYQPYCLVDWGTVTRKNSAGEFENEYKFLLSTVCGGVVAYFFLIFCLDASIRAIKLGVLQIIAPIPILSLIDPKEGDKKLKTWASECGKEYVGLFIRLAGVFFAVSVIQLVINPEQYDAMKYFSSDGTIGTQPAGIFVKLFIIIGALMFAKQLPQFIDNILGTKLASNKGSFNLMKRLGETPGVGALGRTAALGAKKTIAGIDSARHGKGFWNGTKNVQGNGRISKMQKVWRDITPHQTKFNDERKKARESISERDKNLALGKNLYNQYGGSEDELLKTFHPEYSESYKRSKELKGQMFKAESELEAAKQSGDAAMIQVAQKNYAAAKKQYELANAKHEDMKLIYSDDAKRHDAFDLYDKVSGEASISGSSSTSPSSSVSSSSPSSIAVSSPSESSTVYDRVKDITGQTHMENRERNDWEHDSAFAKMSDSDFNEMARRSSETAEANRRDSEK